MNKKEFKKSVLYIQKELGISKHEDIYEYLPNAMVIRFQMNGINWKLYRMKGTEETALLRSDSTEWIEVKDSSDFTKSIKKWIKRIEKDEGMRAVTW